MTKEKLLSLGVPEEALGEILKALESASAKVSAKEAELSAAGETIQELRRTVQKYDGKDPDKLSEELNSLQQKYESDLQTARLDHALDVELMGAGARDVRAVKPFLDPSLLKLDNGKLLGLEEQLSALKTERDFLFQPAQPETSGAAASVAMASAMNHGGEPSGSLDAFMAAAMEGAGLSTPATGN